MTINLPTLTFIKELAVEAGARIKAAGAQSKHITDKASYSDVVTETDVAVEKYLIDAIKRKFGSHKFFCEETTSHAAITKDPTWIIDPIDGTTNFVHTHPDHGVSIGFAIDKQPLMGVIYLPLRDELYSAERGKGAFLNGEQIHVADQTRSMRESLVATGFMVGFLHKSDANPAKRAKFRQLMLDNFTTLLDNSKDIRRCGSAATDLTMVASGRVDAYAEIGVWPWDYCAGKILVEEAGGVCLEYDGKPLELGTRHVIAASSLDLAKEIASHLSRSSLADTEF